MALTARPGLPSSHDCFVFSSPSSFSRFTVISQPPGVTRRTWIKTWCSGCGGGGSAASSGGGGGGGVLERSIVPWRMYLCTTSPSFLGSFSAATRLLFTPVAEYSTVGPPSVARSSSSSWNTAGEYVDTKAEMSGHSGAEGRLSLNMVLVKLALYTVSKSTYSEGTSVILGGGDSGGEAATIRRCQGTGSGVVVTGVRLWAMMT
mmetsp:Transcript_13098/g.30198  ORF Transcript_13098/g.30198 Transcript_13098/m.30198 type:complete len:204 (-) Transcript_13098:2085-2696(-)